MEGEGFEPPNPKERIYSPPRLASSLSLLKNKKQYNTVSWSKQAFTLDFND